MNYVFLSGSGLCSPLAQSFSRQGGKKRALSVSPSPDLELHGRIRSSPSALYSAAAAYGASCSRSSSTSGSYGHLNPLAFTMQHHPSVMSPQVQQLLRSASGLHLPWHNAASVPSANHHASYNLHMLPIPSQDSSQVNITFFFFPFFCLCPPSSVYIFSFNPLILLSTLIILAIFPLG